jgi:hypothetical protein
MDSEQLRQIRTRAGRSSSRPAIRTGRARETQLRGNSGVSPLRLPLIHRLTVNPVLAIFPLFLFEALFSFFALFVAVAHPALLSLV